MADACAASVTITDESGITYLGEGRPERLFNPTPGMWFTNQSEEVLAALHAAFERDPYPPPAEVERLAKQVGAPSPAQVETFYANMRLLSNA